jgi:hypothetical protein
MEACLTALLLAVWSKPQTAFFMALLGKKNTQSLCLRQARVGFERSPRIGISLEPDIASLK